ncbi:hypothetical protein J6590_049278 [Homalodisca vitripennis]|nr:hypothetical protein J6590_049278 [Homalodisca vitripennis]
MAFFPTKSVNSWASTTTLQQTNSRSTFGVKTFFSYPEFYASEDYNYVSIQLNSTLKWSKKIKPVKQPKKAPKGDLGDPFVYKGVFYGQFAAGTMNNPCSAESDPLLLANTVTVTGWIKKITSKKEDDC